jgi:hypothetical protein
VQLVHGFAEPDHDPRLGQNVRGDAFHSLKHGERTMVSGLRAVRWPFVRGAGAIWVRLTLRASWVACNVRLRREKTSSIKQGGGPYITNTFVLMSASGFPRFA